MCVYVCTGVRACERACAGLRWVVHARVRVRVRVRPP